MKHEHSAAWLPRVARLGAVLLGMGCGDAEPPTPQHAELEGGVLAQVGDVTISHETVAKIAEAQGLAPSDALQIAIGDALFEAEMRRRGALDPASPSFDHSLARRARAELSRALLSRIGQKVAGPVTDAELQSLTEKYWMQVRRPKAWRVAHVLVLADDPTPEQREAAEKQAQAIVEAMAPIVAKTRASVAPDRHGAMSSEETRSIELRELVGSLADSAPPGQARLETKVEELPPIVEEGWALVPSRQRFEPDFVKAAAALKERGDVSPLTWSPFGVHVILLLEILPGDMRTDEELRRLFLREATAVRARAEQQALLEGLREKTTATLTPGIDALLREINEGS